MQTASSETENKSLDLSICVHHYTLRAPCPKGQGILLYRATNPVLASFQISTSNAPHRLTRIPVNRLHGHGTLHPVSPSLYRSATSHSSIAALPTVPPSRRPTRWSRSQPLQQLCASPPSPCPRTPRRCSLASLPTNLILRPSPPTSPPHDGHGAQAQRPRRRPPLCPDV